MEPLRVLTFTSLYPSTARPRHGIFVETRLRHLLRHADVDVRVVAPVPWFPLRGAAFGRYGEFAATPRRSRREPGIHVEYPRYLMLPRIGVRLQPDSMATAALSAVEALRRSGWTPQVIDAHYLYPDGVAARLLARRLGVPYVLTARGTDVNVLARQADTGPRTLAAVADAAAVVAVSPSLRDVLVELGADAMRIEVLRNGVDTELFFPEEPTQARAALGLDSRPLMLSVGNLVPEKGQAMALQALARLPGWQLALVGDGPQAGALRTLARTLGVAERVRFVPVQPQAQLRRWYSASEVLALCSTREGWPNVVLEALACGTPVVATDVGAVREMIRAPWQGEVIVQGDSAALALACERLHRDSATAARLVAHAAGFDWASIARRQFDLLSRCASGASPFPTGPAQDIAEARP